MPNKRKNQITKEQIFTNAMFQDAEGGWMLIETAKPGYYYAYGDKFDISAVSIQKMVERLNDNGFYFVGKN